MDPNIQLIQMMLRVEREEAAHCRPQVTDSTDLAAEKPVYPAKSENRIKPIFTLARRRQLCEGA